MLSCNRSGISDRKRSLNDSDIDRNLDTFIVMNEFSLDISLPKDTIFVNNRLIIRVDNYCVYNGSLDTLRKHKIGFPESNNYKEGSYLIAVNLIDFDNELIYSWSSDDYELLKEEEVNIINLLYTGKNENEKTLRIEYK